MRILSLSVFIVLSFCAATSAQVKFEYARFSMWTHHDFENPNDSKVVISFHSAGLSYQTSQGLVEELDTFPTAFERVIGRKWIGDPPAYGRELALLNALGEAGWQIIDVEREEGRATRYLLQRVRE